MNTRLQEKFGWTTNIIYYDVKNFSLETEFNDDTDDELGLRKSGASKEEKSLPIVQMGIFMDEQGLPISIKTFPENTLDNLTMINSLKENIENLNLKRFIFVGNIDMYWENNTYCLSNYNNGYIISKSIEKTSAVEKN